MADPVNTTVTKNGTHLAFYEKPWRAYTVDAQPDADRDTFRHEWTPEEPWGRVPSVTAVNGVLDKSGPLVGWAVNVTCESAWRMDVQASSPTITKPIVAGLRKEANKAEEETAEPWWPRYLRARALQVEKKGRYFMPSKWRQFQREMRLGGFDHTSVTKEAQLRGTTVHKIGEDWVNEGKFPNLADYPESWRGYVRAIAAFLGKHGDGLAVAEQITGSVKHGFAGTCDTVAVTTFGNSRVRLDYKTSRQVYARTHFRQLGAYELAAVEGGDEPSDRLAVVVLGSDGAFSIHFADEVEWRTTPADAFLRVLDVWRDEQPLKKHEDATYKARRARER